MLLSVPLPIYKDFYIFTLEDNVGKSSKNGELEATCQFQQWNLIRWSCRDSGGVWKANEAIECLNAFTCFHYKTSVGRHPWDSADRETEQMQSMIAAAGQLWTLQSQVSRIGQYLHEKEPSWYLVLGLLTVKNISITQGWRCSLAVHHGKFPRPTNHWCTTPHWILQGPGVKIQRNCSAFWQGVSGISHSPEPDCSQPQVGQLGTFVKPSSWGWQTLDQVIRTQRTCIIMKLTRLKHTKARRCNSNNKPLFQNIPLGVYFDQCKLTLSKTGGGLPKTYVV